MLMQSADSRAAAFEIIQQSAMRGERACATSPADLEGEFVG